MAAGTPSIAALAATARNVSTGAPRLYRAARQAGATGREAMEVLATSAAVLVLAARRAGGQPARQNAVRHFTWQAVLTARQGLQVATAVADAQERGSARPRDTAVDQRNNAAGQAWGHAHQDELAGCRLRTAIDRAFAGASTAWDAGGLAH